MSDNKILDMLLKPLQPKLDHPEVTDIIANKPGRFAYRQNGKWSWLDIPELDHDAMDVATILIGKRSGREFDEAHPYVNSTLPGGQRFQGVRQPGTKDGSFLWAIRRPPTRARTIDDDDFTDLFDNDTEGSRASRVTSQVIDYYRQKDWRRLFHAARHAGMSIGFVGPTGGGKTDMGRRMIQTGRNVRIVTVETDDEYGDAGPENKASLIYNEDQVTPEQAVKIALRLIPVEIFFQEIRGAEAYWLLRAMSSGHPGCTTWHGDEGREF
jgi:type IV secretory pathway ATPase VirB11/archaellum biosynthesis ATPase